MDFADQVDGALTGFLRHGGSKARDAVARAMKAYPYRRAEKLPRGYTSQAPHSVGVGAGDNRGHLHTARQSPPSMATTDTTSSANTPSLAELQALLAKTNAAIAERRVEELKVLADGYAKKLAMNGFEIREGMDALKPYLRLKPRSAG